MLLPTISMSACLRVDLSGPLSEVLRSVTQPLDHKRASPKLSHGIITSARARRAYPGPQLTVPVEIEKWNPIRDAMAKPKSTRVSRIMMMPLARIIVPPARGHVSKAEPFKIFAPLISTNLLPKDIARLQGHFRHMNSSDGSGEKGEAERFVRRP